MAYPTTWLNLVLPAPAVYRILLVGHAVLAGAGVAALGQRWGMSGPAAALAGAAWCASGPLLYAGSLHQHFCGAAWMAWVPLALESALAAPGARSAAWLGAAAAAGRVAFWLLARPARPARRAVAATALGAVALAFALAAVQWVPSASLLTSVERGRLRAAEILYWSVHPLSGVDLFVPRFLADLPLSPGLRAALFEGREPFLVSLYVGLSSLALVIFVRSRRWDPPGYAVAMAVLFGLAALGRHAFPLSVLLTTPPFSLSRYPAKHALPFAMFWALAAGFGLDAWRRPWESFERRRASIVLALLAFAAVAVGAGALWVRREVHPAMRLLHIPGEFSAEASYLLTTKLNRTAAIALAVVGGSRTAASPRAALLAIAEPDFDPASEVVLADGGPRVPVPGEFRARCAIRERRADRLVVEVEASAGGHLVVAEAYQDGWRARVDGGAAPVVPANVLFRAVAVPAGSHRVELRYRPPAALWGALLTAAGLLVLAGLFVPRSLLRRER